MGRREDVDNSIWADDDFLALTAHARYVYLWSFTNPHCNMAGLYKFSRRIMMLETGLTAKQVDATLEELAAAGFIAVYDGFLWVCARLKYLRSKGGSIARNVAKDLGFFDDDHPLRVALLRKYAETPWLSDELSGLSVVEPKTDTPPAPSAPPDTGVPGRAGQGKEGKNGLTETVDAAPDDLPADLIPVVAEVKAILERVVFTKGGTVVPSLRSVGRIVGRFPRRDHVAEAEKLEHWLLEGNGRNQANKDVVARYRTWLGNAADSIAPRRPTAATYDPAAMHAELKRRLAEDER